MTTDGPAPPLVLGRAFKDLKCISKATLDVLKAQGFKNATPVQEATIPLLCGHKDVAVDAATGSGKTLAFIIPVIEKLRKLEEPLKRNQVGAIIVSPTRELARQTFDVAAPFVASLAHSGSSSGGGDANASAATAPRALLLVGGSDPAADVAAFRAGGAALLVGTPGRLDDVMARCAELDARRLEVLILDEADRLLDMGFQRQLDAIMARLPKQRRTGLFSATQTDAVEALMRAGLRNPVRVAVAVAAAAAAGGSTAKRAASAAAAAAGPPSATAAAAGNGAGATVTPATLRLEYIACEVEEKLGQLIAFLAAHASTDKVIAYFLTCASVEHASLALKRHPLTRALAVTALHGRMKQAQREAALAAFAAAPAGVLLATDLAARGLDLPDVAWVVQHDAPQDPAAFVHRVGRTARMGRSGSALAFLAPSELSYVELLRLRRVPLIEAPKLAGAPADLAAWLRAECESDREMMERATRAFVAYVRGYKEHQLKYIFRLQDLNLGRLAAAMGLLRLPRMPETKRVADFEPSLVDPESVPFRDKAREKQRQRQLKQRAAAAEAAGTAGKQQQQQQRGKQHGKQGGGNAAAAANAEPRLPMAKRRQLAARDEAEELSRDYALLKKFKRGKISRAEFEAAAGFSSGSESDGGGGAGGADGGGGADGSSAARLLAKKAKKKKKKKRRVAAAAAAAAAANGGG